MMAVGIGQTSVIHVHLIAETRMDLAEQTPVDKPGAWITPAMLDQIEEDDPLCLLSHGDAWYNWPQRWKAMRTLVDEPIAQRDPGEALEALREALECIRVFHGPVGWEQYLQSPEMKRFNALLEGETKPAPQRELDHEVMASRILDALVENGANEFDYGVPEWREIVENAILQEPKDSLAAHIDRTNAPLYQQPMKNPPTQREPGEGPIKPWMTDPYLITRRNEEVAAAIAKHLREE